MSQENKMILFITTIIVLHGEIEPNGPNGMFGTTEKSVKALEEDTDWEKL